MGDHRDPLDIGTGIGGAGETAARITLEERPEVVACLNGLEFPDGEPLLALLRASMLALAGDMIEDLHEDETFSASIVCLQARAKRVFVLAKAMEVELRKQRNEVRDLAGQNAAYQAEMLELIHGPPPLIELGGDERKLLSRRAVVSLQSEENETCAAVEVRQQELQTLLEDLELLSESDFPYFVTRLPIPQVFEWLSRWGEELSKQGQDAASELAALRATRKRLVNKWAEEDQFA